MRIMATSDLHGNLEGLDPKGADVVVLAGDIAPLRGRGVWHVNDQKKWINKKFREWTQLYPDVKFVVIPGNHDFYPIAHILFKDYGIDWGFSFSDNVQIRNSSPIPNDADHQYIQWPLSNDSFLL